MGRLSKINTLLLVLIVLVNSYVILTPLAPMIALHMPGHDKKQQVLTSKIHTKPAAAQPTATANSLTIPAMLLDQPILDGRDTYKVLNQGILRWPSSSTPDKGSNTVLLGHRFTYHQPKGVFYYLDKLKPGDEIGVTWNNQKYVYKVRETKVVPPTETSILAGTDKPQLTLFTCTPLLWPKDRLVVIADLVQTVRSTRVSPYPQEVTP